MPKRKQSDDYEKLLKKFKKLEKKVRRRCRGRSRSSRSSSQERERSADESNDVIELLGDEVTHECEETNAAVLEPIANTASNLVEDPIAPAVEPSFSGEPSATDTVLDSAILEILGDDPTISHNYGPEIHKDLAVRLEHIVSHGLTKELRKELFLKYLLPSNCTLINAPTLNAEIKVAISDINSKRDKNIEDRQKQIAIAISCISQAMNGLISKNDTDKASINLLMDSQRILCDAQYNDTILRRNFVLSALKKDMKEQLLNTKPDNFLFGQNLSETIKTAKAINKSGAELKTPTPKPQSTIKKQSAAAASTSRNLNWKGPYPVRKQQQNPARTKEPPPNRNRPSNSSRHSQNQRTRGRR